MHARHRRQLRHRTLQGRVEPHTFSALEREPRRLVSLGIQRDRCRHGADLLAGVEQPGIADAVDPRTVRREGGLVDVSGEDDVRPICAIQPIKAWSPKYRRPFQLIGELDGGA